MNIFYFELILRVVYPVFFSHKYGHPNLIPYSDWKLMSRGLLNIMHTIELNCLVTSKYFVSFVSIIVNVKYGVQMKMFGLLVDNRYSVRCIIKLTLLNLT